MAFISSVWYALLGSFLVLRAFAQDYSISNYTVTGTGCVPGSVSATVTSGGKNIAVNYNNFVASAGPNVDIDDNRKNCQLTLTVKTPSGYQFAFDRFSYNGSYSVGANVKASFGSSYYFQAQLDQATGGDFSVGPAKDDCAFADTFDPPVWSPCGGSNIVGINTSIRVDNTANTGASGGVTVHVNPAASFVWRKC